MAGNEVITGYHGTNFDNVESILEKGLYKAKPNDRWFGPGIYFFIDHFGNPIENAKQWAIGSALDDYFDESQENKRLKYDATFQNRTLKYAPFKDRKLKYAVFQADILVFENECIDFRTPDGAELFDSMANEFFAKLEDGSDIKLKKGHLDGYICNELNEMFDYNVFIANRFIRLAPLRRFDYSGYTQRQANCTICAVYNSDLITNLKVIKEGRML